MPNTHISGHILQLTDYTIITTGHVRLGSSIVSDQWRAYMGVLSAAGYNHYTVNHSRAFVDQDTGAHTVHKILKEHGVCTKVKCGDRGETEMSVC